MGDDPQQVMDKINARIEDGYKDESPRRRGTGQDDKLRKQMHDETAVIKKNLVKFDGQKGPGRVDHRSGDRAGPGRVDALHERAEIHPLLLL